MRRRFVRNALSPFARRDAARGHRCEPHAICEDFAQIFVELVRLVWSTRERQWQGQAGGATARGHRCHTHPICENVAQMFFELVWFVWSTRGRKCCCCACLRVCVCVPVCMREGEKLANVDYRARVASLLCMQGYAHVRPRGLEQAQNVDKQNVMRNARPRPKIIMQHEFEIQLFSKSLTACVSSAAPAHLFPNRN